MKPNVIKDLGGDWRFTFSEEIDLAIEEFHKSIEYLGIDEDITQTRIKVLIDKFPDSHIDAFNHLSISYDNQNKSQLALQFAMTAYMIGSLSFPSKFNHTKNKLDWLILDNRPYLRTLYNLGIQFLKRRDLIRSEQLFSQILRYNPKDNQGVRYLLLDIYDSNKETEKSYKLQKMFPEENLRNTI